MIITRLEVAHFRNHIATAVDWSPHINVLVGPNGAGKTSLIDAIHYLCMSRSFVSSSDQYGVQKGERHFTLTGTFEGNIRSEFEVTCVYGRGEGKKMFVNDSPLPRLSDLVGMVPVVVLSPDDKRLTREGPVERRAFIDSFIAQISSAYLRDLLDYRRIRKQRNALLQHPQMDHQTKLIMLDPWDVQLIETGSRIIQRRYEVLEKFKSYLANDYAMISGMNLTTDLAYQTFCDATKSLEEIMEQYRA
ncbi:MAG: DNA replication and repair protein RecF, partial [Bacteroidota bacterium]